MFVYVFAFPKFVSEQVMTAFTCFVYGPVMLSFIYLSRNLENGIYYVWLIFISSWISDTCAYLVGVSIGKHKLAPILSPKKSIEGAAGGILGSALVGALYGYFVIAPRVNNAHVIWILAVISSIGALISQVGDLAASGIKRNHEIKDYGKLIPGHGGVMNRFDSVIFTAPIVYGMLILWMKL
jgi:phosphatidate cytidylyltransferase